MTVPASVPVPRSEARLLVALSALTATTGATEAASFLRLHDVFTANMTGNVLLLGFSVTGWKFVQPVSVEGYVIALAGFVAGALFGGRLAGARGRPATLWRALAFEATAVRPPELG